MLKSRILSLIKSGESTGIEFKECGRELGKSVYETVYAFLNRNGGELLLGVKDNGVIAGIEIGVRNIVKYSEIYTKSIPQFIEENIFKIIIPLTEQVTEQVIYEEKITAFCAVPKSGAEIMEHLGLKHREHFRSEILQKLLAAGKLKMTAPDKPKSSKQKYVAVKKKIETGAILHE